MPFNQRLKIFEAINGSSIHQSLATASSQVAIMRCQANVMTDPQTILETLRSIIQPEINNRIQKVLADIAESHFMPAIQNMKMNLAGGEETFATAGLLEEVCIAALEAAKELYLMPPRGVAAAASPADMKKPNAATAVMMRGKCPSQVLKRSSSGSTSSSPVMRKSMVIKSGLGRPNTDLILVNKAGRPVRREGPKWEADRLSGDTLFILGSRANKALGFGQTRGRLYIKHPELFKYSGDQTDKEWLAKANLMATTGGKAYLMVLQDILDLVESPEYSAHPKQQPGELVGFSVPDWMIEKMRAYIETARTHPDTTDEELLRMAEEYAEMEEERRTTTTTTTTSCNKVSGDQQQQQLMDRLISSQTAGTSSSSGTSSSVDQLLIDIKHETMDDDLQNLDPGFLQGMNLHNLVREFEMDTSGESELNLLALADDTLPALQ